jgi:hypothetical protein
MFTETLCGIESDIENDIGTPDRFYTSILKGDDFGVGHLDFQADDGSKHSADSLD